MKARNTPCTECRKQRRKCVRPDSATKCTRCERLGRECLMAPKTDSDSNDSDENITNLQNQVEQLEAAIESMEVQLRQLRFDNNHDSNHMLSRLSDPMIQHLMSNWKIKIKNGGFQIETGIKSITELLQINPQLSYLSPLSSSYSEFSFDDTDSKTDSYSSFESTYLGESNLILRFAEEKHSLSSITMTLVKQALKGKVPKMPRSLLMPPTLLLNTQELVNGLIDVFFTCHNIANPYLHEKTFRQQIKKVQDPLSDLLILCICSYVCSNPCEHIVYSAWEGRSIADFFYAKAKNILFDQFDEEDKRLENVIAINILVRYLHVTLKLAECRQLTMMAYDLCLNLRKDFLDKLPPPHLSCFNYEIHLKATNFVGEYIKSAHEEKPPSENVNKALFSRHVTYTVGITFMLDYISGYFDARCVHLPPWEYLEDEPEMTKKYIKSFNWVLRLFSHPFVEKFMKQIRQIHLGKECTLSFESIIKIEEVMAEWAASTPKEYRLCNNFKKPDVCKRAIDEATDPVLIMDFVQFHSFYIQIYSCLLQPAPSQTSSDLLQYVRQHSLEQAFQSCHLMLYAVRHLSTSPNLSFCNYLLESTDYLFDAMDILSLLAVSSDQHIANEAKKMMKSCLKEIDSIKIMQDHQVPKHASPLHNTAVPTREEIIADLDYYDQYPQPWYALMYDLSHSVLTEDNDKTDQ